MSEFLNDYQSERDFIISAFDGDNLIGSASICGLKSTQNEARLRWVILDESYHDKGIGHEMLTKCISFCRTKGFSKIFLWTVSGLPGSFRLYEKLGFTVVEQHQDSRYGAHLESLKMELTLD